MENCNNYQERISALIDGQLTDEERLELLEHMADCPACQQYFDDQTAIHDALTGLEADAPAGFTDSVMARVRETAQDVPRRKTIPFPHWQRWAATAACCALALLGVMGLQRGGSHELGSAAQDAVLYSAVRTEEDAGTTADIPAVADTAQPVGESSVLADSAPTEGVTACSTDADDLDTPATTASSPPLESAARTEVDAKSTKVAACTLTTSSPLAAQWVEENLAQPWQSGSSYPLTEAQFLELRALLEDAGELYTSEAAENGEFLLLAAP